MINIVKLLIEKLTEEELSQLKEFLNVKPQVTRSLKKLTLRNARQLKGISQEVLADHIGCLQCEISTHERGIKKINPKRIQAISKVLGYSPESIDWEHCHSKLKRKKVKS